MQTYQLFGDGELLDYMRERLRAATEILHNIPQDQFLNATAEELLDHVLTQTTMEPLTLEMAGIKMTTAETTVDMTRSRAHNFFQEAGPFLVHATKVTVIIPFTGEPVLWKFRPSSSPVEKAFGRLCVVPHELAGQFEFDITQPAGDAAENLKSSTDHQLRLIQTYVRDHQIDVARYNRDLSAHVAAQIQGRRSRILQNEGLSGVLGIPLARKPGAPSIEPIKLIRRLVRPLRPAPTSGYQDEPEIDEAVYQHILGVIRHGGRTFEATPKTFQVHDEEELRDILLAHLNGHYQGDATGETFRRKGKTDIRIEDGNRAAFVAECKVWKGPQEFCAAIDQLLGYLTWRDCKASVVIFNKHNAKFSRILESVPQVLTAHPLYRTVVEVNKQGEWGCRMTSATDGGRQLNVHVFVFDLYVK